MVNNFYMCPTCDKRHDFTPYVIARLNQGLEHRCNACGGITRLSNEGIHVVKAGAENPQYWAANGHYPCVTTLRGDIVPRVFAYSYDGAWYAQREDNISNIEASIERVKSSLPPQLGLDLGDDPPPRPTPWYGPGDKPARDGWYHLLFEGGESPKNWFYYTLEDNFAFEPGHPVTLQRYQVKGWRGQDRES